MFAPQLIYATLPNLYPRLLAEDGVHESLVLPALETGQDIIVPFLFYAETGSAPLNVEIINARVYNPVTQSWDFPPFTPTTVDLSLALHKSLVVLTVMEIDLPGRRLQAYPFRVYRPETP